ncbi:terminase large subunit [Staphylococcus phage Machias]|nr:terminase large subunit [Staphylococcus phage Machias]
MNEAAQWNEKIYDYFIDSEEEGNSKLEKYMEDNSNNEFMYIEYSYKELGKDENWLEKQKRQIGSLEAVKREILLEWAYSSDDSLFSEEQMTEISMYANKEIYNTLEFNIDGRTYYVNMIKYMDNITEKNWLIGIDMSGGLGRDNTAFTVVDPATLEPVMTFKNNVINGPTFRKLIKELVSFYIPNAILIPERNYAGLTVIDHMISYDGLESNLFYTLKTRVAEKQVENKSLFNEMSRYSKTEKVKKETRRYGIDTTKKSRDIMLNEILSMLVEEKPHLINNKPLFQEIKSLQMIKGRIDHPPGGHDDLMMSYLFCLYAYYYEKDINKFVKIKYGSKLSPNSENAEGMKKEQEARRKDIASIKRINSVIEGNDMSNSIFGQQQKPMDNNNKRIMDLFK